MPYDQTPVTGDDDSKFVDPITEAIKTLAEYSAGLCERIDAIETQIEKYSDWPDFKDSLDKEAQAFHRSKGIESVGAKIKGNPEHMGALALMDGDDDDAKISEIYDMLDEAKKAASGEEFDEDGALGGLFGSLKTRAQEIADRVAKHGKPVAAEVKVEGEEAPPEGEDDLPGWMKKSMTKK